MEQFKEIVKIPHQLILEIQHKIINYLNNGFKVKKQVHLLVVLLHLIMDFIQTPQILIPIRTLLIQTPTLTLLILIPTLTLLIQTPTLTLLILTLTLLILTLTLLILIPIHHVKILIQIVNKN